MAEHSERQQYAAAIQAYRATMEHLEKNVPKEPSTKSGSFSARMTVTTKGEVEVTITTNRQTLYMSADNMDVLTKWWKEIHGVDSR